MPIRRNKYQTSFLKTKNSKPYIIANIIMALAYFIILAVFFPVGNHVLFGLLIFGEVFHLWQLFTFLYTIWDMRESKPLKSDYYPEVDIYVTVAGEPADVIEETIRGILAMQYPTFHTYILNDGFVAGREN